MKERGILFSVPMVRAILDGRKTMTRRVCKIKLPEGIEYEPDPEDRDGSFWSAVLGANDRWGKLNWLIGAKWGSRPMPKEHEHLLPPCVCPYGVKGDRLWVRETHWAYGRWVRDGFTKKGNPKWRFARVKEMPVRFEEPQDPWRKSRDKAQPGKEQWYVRLGRFMPKAYARITLEVTGVRVERLQEISEEDARAEGAKPSMSPGGWTLVFRGGQTSVIFDGYEPVPPKVGDVFQFGTVTHVERQEPRKITTARSDFGMIWKRINGPESWDANPWVWVVEFKRV